MTPKTYYRKPCIVIVGLIATCFFYLISSTWLKWGELIIDTYRELFTPYELLKGKILYKDIFYPYGFLPPYIISWLYKIFGVSIITVVSCGIVITALMSFLLYKISRIFLDEVFSALVVITFLFVFAFGYYVYNGIFNFIMPYSYASTFFMLFTSAALYFFLRFIKNDKRKYLIFWNILLSCAIWSRPDISLSVWIGFLFIGCVYIWKNKVRDSIAIFFYFISPLIISVLGYLVFLHRYNAFAGFKESIIDCIRINAGSALTRSWFGLDHPSLNIYMTIKSFILHITVLALLGLSIALSSFKSFKDGTDSDSSQSIIGNLIVLTFGLLILFWGRRILFLQYRCIPIILLIGIPLIFIKTVRASDFKKNLSLLALFIVSALTMLRIFLNTSPINYGFYLLSLCLICYYIFYLDFFKTFLLRWIKIPSTHLSSAFFIFFTLLIIPHWEISSTMYSYKGMFATTDKGKIFCMKSPRSVLFWQTVDYITQNTMTDETVAIFPEGVGINFFSGRSTPLRYYTFLPPDVKTIGETRMIAEIKFSKLDYAVLVSRDTTEYGYPVFGIDYAKDILAYILQNYEIVKEFGPSPLKGTDFGIIVFKRKNK